MVIDMTNVTVINREAEDAILDLIMKRGANFSCGGALTKRVVKQLARKIQQESPRR